MKSDPDVIGHGEKECEIENEIGDEKDYGDRLRASVVRHTLVIQVAAHSKIIEKEMSAPTKQLSNPDVEYSSGDSNIPLKKQWKKMAHQKVDSLGSLFTWCNRGKFPNRVEDRLDRAFANPAWYTLWHSSIITNLTKYVSDHCPILLECCLNPGNISRKKNKLYRLENFWLSNEECETIVHHSWVPSREITLNINQVGTSLLDCSRKTFGSIPKRIKECREKLKNLQEVPYTVNMSTKEEKLFEKELDELLEQEEIRWKQRSRAYWLNNGDHNTFFFHKKAS
ncbi:hypothetical protein RIF29_18683 [Crotalaria pallida]|uniref:Uncharacterized protein n=1 Tax=Crotalaria pallida TaxID=3830 RepID=A0AAN9EZV6_CROPI